ncbi:glycosyltransferase family 4 protein [Photobacterium damselae]|uniref:glycosyltransferase family 4 protein n=1 Tax=Photobacterium damselae TaxID=38293 RepID=UPI000D661EA7|nr:glycosyltransferase [Photobacterium damselae]AWK81318.1 hypothetical protein BST98_04205 [Photobacterium damselae]
MNLLIINTAKNGGRAECAYHINKYARNSDGFNDYFIIFPSKVSNLNKWDSLESDYECLKLDFHSLNPFTIIKNLFEIKKFYKNNKIDNVLFTATHPLSLLYMSIFNKNNISTVIHDPLVKLNEKFFDKNILISFYFYLVNNLIERFSDKIILLSRAFIDIYREKYTNKEVIHMPHGFFDDFLTSSNNKKFDICFAGRITKYKGLDLLISAVEKLDDKYSVVIAGSGNDLCLDKLTSKENYTLFNEWISDKKLCDIISSSKIVVLPYRSASQSGVITLSQACSVPVITTNVGGLGEQVTDSVDGLVIQKENEELLVTAIVSLLESNDKYYSMVNELDLKKDKLSWANITKKLMNDLGRR